MSEDDSNGTTNTKNIALIAASESEVCATVTVLESYDSIRGDIEDGDIGRAFIQLCVRSEKELHERIEAHIEKVDPDLQLTKFIKDETGLQEEGHGLAWYVSSANRIGLVESEHREALSDLADERNKLVHETSYVEKLKYDESKQKEVENMLLEVINFLTSSEE